MFGNGKIFISHSHADNQRSQPLLAALDAWQLDYWFDTQELDVGQRFSDRIQQALDERDIFVRICTPDAMLSFWMDRELRAIRGLHKAFPKQPRLIIHLILSPNYHSDVATKDETIIDTTSTLRIDWLRELHLALGYVPEPRVSRRAAIGIGAASLAAVASTVLAGKFYFTTQPGIVNMFHPQTTPHTATLQPGAERIRWQASLSLDPAVIPLYNSDNTNYLVGIVADDTAIYTITPSNSWMTAWSIQNGTTLWYYPHGTSQNNTISGTHVIHIAGNTIYLLAEVNIGPLNLIALDKSTGKLLWQSDPIGTGDSSYSRLCVTDNTIFFQDEGKVYAYNTDGTTRWSPVTLFSGTAYIASDYSTPVFSNNTLFIGISDGKLYALNATTGSIRWKNSITSSIVVGTSEYMTTHDFPLQSSPAVANGVVYIGAFDGYCYAFDATTGKQQWKTQIVTVDYTNYHIYAFTSTPLVANGIVYLQGGSNNDGGTITKGKLFALDTKDGHILWQVDPTQLPLQLSNVIIAPNINPPYINGETIYFTFNFSFNNGTNPIGAQILLALKASDGTLQWYYMPEVTGITLQNGVLMYFPSTPVPVPGGIAFLTSQSTLYVLNT